MPMQNHPGCAPVAARSRTALRRLAAVLLLVGVSSCRETSGPTTGTLDVSISGLPAASQGAVTITGPAGSGFSRLLTASETLSDLPTGRYTLTATAITQAGVRYSPTPASQVVEVKGGSASTMASVAYAVSSAALNITIGGVPAGMVPSVTVTGPNGFSVQLSATATLTTLEPGQYTVAAAEIVAGSVSGGGHVYSATPLSQGILLAASATPRSVTLTYALVTGALEVTVSGLPQGASGDVLVTGPGGFRRALTGSASLVGLYPGVYTVAGSNVTVSGALYTSTPSAASVDISASLTPRQVTLTYSTGGTAPHAFNLLIDGMYVTQTVQTYTGTIPLIAGKAGFLRVFVRATTANAAQPNVRVRLYDGATLVQTLTLTPGQASVPIDISEGTLGSSWNVGIPASLIQPGLSILADVDPTNAIQESDESDNQFPLNGTPLAPVVHTTQPLNVVFVPIQHTSNGATGNVTDANKDQFLAFAQKVFPIKDFVATVHATYSTSTPPVESNDGNGSWTQLLSEVNALRIAEGSALYHMGIVDVSYSSGIAGYGYAPGRAAVTWEHLPSGAPVAAHELAHNLGRYHAPCGNVAAPDPFFPYPAGIIGVYGYDVALNVLKPATSSDLMGYCGFSWISDYNYLGILNYRISTPNAAVVPNAAAAPWSGVRAAPEKREASVQSSTVRPSLVVWGRIENGRPVLEPAFTALTRPALPSRPGPHRIEARAADGRVLFAYSFEGDEPVDLPDGNARHFAFAIPVDAAQPIASLRLTSSTGQRSERAVTGARAPAADDVEASVPRVGEVMFRVRDPGVKMAVIRERATGQIVAFVRGATATVKSHSADFDVELSDGVRSVTRVVRAVRR